MFAYGWVSQLERDTDGSASFRIDSFDRVTVSEMSDEIVYGDTVLIQFDLSNVAKLDWNGVPFVTVYANGVKKLSPEEVAIFQGFE